MDKDEQALYRGYWPEWVIQLSVLADELRALFDKSLTSRAVNQLAVTALEVRLRTLFANEVVIRKWIESYERFLLVDWHTTESSPDKTQEMLDYLLTLRVSPQTLADIEASIRETRNDVTEEELHDLLTWKLPAERLRTSATAIDCFIDDMQMYICRVCEETLAVCTCTPAPRN